MKNEREKIWEGELTSETKGRHICMHIYLYLYVLFLSPQFIHTHTQNELISLRVVMPSKSCRQLTKSPGPGMRNLLSSCWSEELNRPAPPIIQAIIIALECLPELESKTNSIIEDSIHFRYRLGGVNLPETELKIFSENYLL